MKRYINTQIIFQNLINNKHIDITSLASSLNISVKSINNYLMNKNVSNEVIEKLFNYLDAMNLDLFDVLDLEDDSCYYHMSSSGIIGKISARYNEGNKYSDFGYGFYLSESFKVAATYFKESDTPIIYKFKKSKIDCLKPYFFKENDKGTEDWIMYIGLNRQKITDEMHKTILNKKYHKMFHSEKCLVGKIADSLNFEVMDEFFDNNYDIFQVKSQLTKANLGYQYVIKDENAANKLMWDEEIILDKGLINLIFHYRSKRNKQLKEDNLKSINLNETKDEYKFLSLIKKLEYEE